MVSARCTPLFAACLLLMAATAASQPETHVSAALQRCKATARCPDAFHEFAPELLDAPTFYARKLPAAAAEETALYLDFEDWQLGGYALGRFADVASNSALFPPTSALAAAAADADAMLTPLHVTDGLVMINTTSLEMELPDGSVRLGELVLLEGGVPAASWTASSIYFGQEASIMLSGSRALQLASSSSLLLATELLVPPGECGGWPAGGQPSAVENGNGDASSNVRLLTATLTTAAANVDEVQTVTTFADDGENVGGHFRVCFLSACTHRLPVSASGDVFAARLAALPDIGDIDVHRSRPDSSGGHTWTVTFLSAVGDVPQLSAYGDSLDGVGVGVSTATAVQGNVMSGSFSLQLLDSLVEGIPFDITAAALRQRLLWAVPRLEEAIVVRSDPIANCTHGLHTNCRGPAGGYSWQLQLMTRWQNVAPAGPAQLGDNTTPREPLPLLVNATMLNGTAADVTLVVTGDVSIAYGGAGGAGGGAGGDGPTPPPPNVGHAAAAVGGRPRLLGSGCQSASDGGAGGAAGGSAQSLLRYAAAGGRVTAGGSGGGVLSLAAANDIIIAPEAALLLPGGDGQSGFQGGGGGGGGSLVMRAGGLVRIAGTLSLAGGRGGDATSNSTSSSSGAGGGGGRICIAAYAVKSALSQEAQSFAPGGAAGRLRQAPGGLAAQAGSPGVLILQPELVSDVSITDDGDGAVGSGRAVELSGAGFPLPSSRRQVPSIDGIGLTLPLRRPQQPSRVTFHFKVHATHAPLQQLRGPYFALHAADGGCATDSEGNIDLGACPQANSGLLGIGVHHGRFVYSGPFLTRPQQQLGLTAQVGHWYRVDILMDWDAARFRLLVDGLQLVSNGTMDTSRDVSLIRAYHVDDMVTRWDEVFVGKNVLRGVACPIVVDGQLVLVRPEQRGWVQDELGDGDRPYSITRHNSHLSEREFYQFNDGNLVFFDGEPHLAHRSDVQLDDDDGSPASRGLMESGALLRADEPDLHADSDAPFYMWYADFQQQPSGQYVVAACSSTDMQLWRLEGLMLHADNVTSGSGQPLPVLERPKVLYNNATQTFVMWLSADDDSERAGAAVVATSSHAAGPFHFNSSWMPEGVVERVEQLAVNETHDMTVMQAGDRAYLLRTYYKTVDYLLPRPVMMPMWESVKSSDGSTAYALSDHRANFRAGYDDVDDIALQVARKENLPWNVTCCREDGSCIDYVPPNADLGIDGGCPPGYAKLVLGQGRPVILSRYKSPDDPVNSEWVPDSVPAITDWGMSVYQTNSWQFNYHSGVPDDNREHATAADQLVGPLQIVQSRRSKYVAVHELSADYTQITRLVAELEGELDDGSQLIAVMSDSQLWTQAALNSTQLRQPLLLKTMEELGFAPKYWNGRQWLPQNETDIARWDNVAAVLAGESPPRP
eukprot:PLAT4420.5.p1 GENE.PLAT4420.5~~PLAT4420.5.p1  ORF type:complete len:1399 (+),score=752.50 PLAT4420.5:50-4246(+)